MVLDYIKRQAQAFGWMLGQSKIDIKHSQLAVMVCSKFKFHLANYFPSNEMRRRTVPP